MQREKASNYILKRLASLDIQQVQALHNIKEGKHFKELLSVFQTMTDDIKTEVYFLENTDPHLPIKKSSLTGRVDGIIVLKQLFEHSSAEFNRRMSEKT